MDSESTAGYPLRKMNSPDFVPEASSTPRQKVFSPSSISQEIHEAAQFAEHRPLADSFVAMGQSRGYLLVKPAELEKYTTEGKLWRLVKMVDSETDKAPPERQKPEHNICLSTVIKVAGMGRVLTVITKTRKVYILESHTLTLLTHFALDLLESSWLKYVTDRCPRPPPFTRLAPSALLCPDGFARHEGQLFIGSTSGLVQVWKLPATSCECLLPPPAPLGAPCPVLGMGWQRFQVYETDMRDIAAPDEWLLKAPMRLRTYLWIFYGDGRGALWQIAGMHQSEHEPRRKRAMIWGDVRGAWSHDFPPMDKRLIRPNPRFTLENLFHWNTAESDRCLVSDGLSGVSEEKAHVVKILQVLSFELSPIVLALAVDSKDRLGLISLSPLIPTPIADFTLLSSLGVHCEANPLICTARLMIDGHAEGLKDALVLEASGLIHVVLVDSKPMEPGINHIYVMFRLFATVLVEASEPIAFMRHEEAFDELLLGLRGGSLLGVPNFSQQLLRHSQAMRFD